MDQLKALYLTAAQWKIFQGHAVLKKIPAHLLFLQYRRRALVGFSGALTKVANSQLEGRMIHGFRGVNTLWKKK